MPGTEDNMVKLVVCDIDGTLLGKDQIQLEGDAAKALGALIESGKKVALASGRSYFSMRKVVSSHPYADELYYICDDGALCVYKGKVLYHKQISIENMLRFSRNSDYKNCPILYFSDSFSYVSGSTPEFLDMLEREGVDRLDPVSGVYDVKAPVYKIGVYGGDRRPKELMPAPFDLRICYRSDNWLEYTSKFANKGLALSDLQMRLYLSKLDTAAFGDGDNDVEMFSKAKYTFARRGGSEKLCAVSSELFDDIADALERL